MIAQEEVGVENLRRDVEKVQAELTKQREDLMQLRTDVDNVSGKLRQGTRPATRDEVKEELSRRFSRYQIMESTVAAKQQLLQAREKSLAAARAKVDNMLNMKRDLEVQVENLASRLKTQQSHNLASSVEVNDTQVARCKGLVDDLRIRLEVADRLLAATGEIGDLPISSVSPSEDIGQQIDRYFAKAAKPNTALAAAR